MFFLGLRSVKVIVNFQAFQPIAFFGAYIYIYHLGAVVGKGKEVMFSKKANWFDWVD